MKVLVIYGSRYHATRDIAEAIGNALANSGLDMAVKGVADAGYMSMYDAFVLGAAVFEGHLAKGFEAFVRKHAKVFSSHPVWLFSSGPIGDPPFPEGEAQDA